MENDIILLTSYSTSDTERFGKLLGFSLKKGITVAITGPLGAGKTYFVKGIANGLGIKDNSAVTSPTFTIINEYSGKYHIYHIDAYRIAGSDEICDLGFDEMFWGDGVALIEWAHKVKDFLPEDVINVEILYVSESKRIIKIFLSGNKYKNILCQFKKIASESVE